ncbi:MAG: glycosyltransferase family 39 protein [Patescibacteria group bacterium]
MQNIKNKLRKTFVKNKILVLIIFFSFVFSLSYSFYFKIIPAVDARGYDNIAINIVNGNGYRESIEGDILHDNSIERVGPLYEFFLAGIYSVFGHNYEAVWIMQAIMHAITAWLVYLICLIIFESKEHKEKTGLAAAAIFGFYPDLIEISAMLMTETFYLFLFALALYLFFRFFNKFNIWIAILLGLVFGLATLARTPVLFLVPIIIYYFYKKKKFFYCVLFIITMSLVFAPWTARNYSVYNKLLPFGTSGAFNFWIGNYHGANGEQEAPAEAREYITAYGATEITSESIRQFTSFIINYPLEFTKLTFLRINKYFSIIRPIGFWFYQSGWGQFTVLISSTFASIILFVFSLAGIIKFFKSKNEKLKYLSAFTIITPLIIFISVVETRYRFQIYPLLAIFAGLFMVYLYQNKKWWLSRVLWASIIIIFTNGIIDLIFSFEKFRERLGWFI